MSKTFKSVSNRAEFEYISKPPETYSNGKPVAMDSNGNSASISQVTQPDLNPSSSAGIPVAKSTMNTVGATLFAHNLDISPIDVEYLEKVHS